MTAPTKYKLIASCEGDADGAVLDMLIAHGCPAREVVLAAMREGERTDIEGLFVERVPGGWHLLREVWMNASDYQGQRIKESISPFRRGIVMHAYDVHRPNGTMGIELHADVDVENCSPYRVTLQLPLALWELDTEHGR
jgi:hypothetical protein